MTMNNGLQQAPWWRIPFEIVFCGFVIVAAFFLITEHSAHFFGALPYALLLACPLIHLFMHHWHGGGKDDFTKGNPPHQH